jgi:hypothetical protein
LPTASSGRIIAAAKQLTNHQCLKQWRPLRGTHLWTVYEEYEKTYRLLIQSCSAVDAVSHQTAPRAQIEKKEILIMQENLRASFQPITSLKIVPQSRRNRPKSHPGSGYFIVNWSKRLENSNNLEIPISSYGALESKPLGESTKASTPQEQKSTKLKTELWAFSHFQFMSSN